MTTILVTLVSTVKDAPVEEITELPSGLPRNNTQATQNYSMRAARYRMRQVSRLQDLGSHHRGASLLPSFVRAGWGGSESAGSSDHPMSHDGSVKPIATAVRCVFLYYWRFSQSQTDLSSPGFNSTPLFGHYPGRPCTRRQRRESSFLMPRGRRRFEESGSSGLPLFLRTMALKNPRAARSRRRYFMRW
jgi:hypothetical protein